MQVIKKNGTIEDYNEDKIKSAIRKSAKRIGYVLSNIQEEEICNNVVEWIGDNANISVDTIHSYVEKSLDLIAPSVAKSYKDYRNYKKEFVYSTIQDIENQVDKTLKDVDRSNSNSNTRYISTKRTEISKIFAKEMYQKMFLPINVIQAIKDGYIYIHDLSDMLLPQYNCLDRNTRFVTSLGVKSFNDFEDGDVIKVLTPFGNWKNAVVRNYGKDMLYELSFKRKNSVYKVKATRNHRWLLSNGEFTDSIQIGDKIYNPCNDTVRKSVFDMNKEEKFYWAWGFSFGDASSSNEKYHIKCRLRLCGNKNKYSAIFEELGFMKYNFDCQDNWYKVHDYFKNVPNFENKEQIIAFVIGYLNADGNLGYGDKNLYRGIYAKSKDAQDLIRNLFPVAGVNITNERDMSNKHTNYGIRKGNPINFGLINSFDKSISTKLIDIKPLYVDNVWCLEVEDDLSFVLENGISTGNCCLADIKSILNGGFNLEGIKYTEPKDIRTAIGQMGDIVQIISAQHFGGHTIPEVHNILVKYYEMSINKEYEYIRQISDMSDIECWELAKQRAYRELKQALQGFEIKMNTVVSARGSYPFTTLTFGDVTNELEADICRAILEVRMEGHGDVGFKKNLIFPKLVFLYNPEIHGKDKKYEWLFDLAVKCSSKCMYPDFLSPKLHKREGKWVSPMGCRAYLSDYRDENGELQFIGRFNIGAISLNLPMIYMKSQNENKQFYEVLDYYLQMIRNLHKDRYEYVGKAKANSNPLMFCEGGAYKGYLKPDDRIAPLLKSATASFGITALNELSVLATGKPISEDNQFAYLTVKYIKDKVEKFKKEDGWLYALYGTPAESLCGTQVEQFRKKYGTIKGVSDKDYFSNSFHCHVCEEITPFEKQDKEIDIFELVTGGHIQYVRIPNTKNIKALKDIIRRGMDLGFYQGVNFNACQCEDCGTTGTDWGETCPHCGSKNITEINRTCGYLGFSRKNGDRTFNDAKMAEIKDRKSM
jgi:ribonucleoside-triphosphate reductase (formate)